MHVQDSALFNRFLFKCKQMCDTDDVNCFAQKVSLSSRLISSTEACVHADGFDLKLIIRFCADFWSLRQLERTLSLKRKGDEPPDA